MNKLLAGTLLIVPYLAYAQEQAQTVRATDLKAQPFSDAVTIARLTESLKVNVLSRKVSWMEIKTPAGNGWVKMLSLRFESAATPGKSDGSALKSLYNLATTGSSGSTVSTDARGLDEYKLSNPSPNPRALEMIRSYALNRQDAEKFAKAEKLNLQRVEYRNTAGEKP